MTQNDNLRNYIGDLETSTDIDVVFKHIYDLMLANGGEGSGLNADMVDGYHASDFAPASLADDLNNCIHEIYIEGNDIPYTGYSVMLTLLTEYITHQNTAKQDINLKEFLNNLENKVNQQEDDIVDIKNLTAFLRDSDIAAKMAKVIRNNVITDDQGEYYLNADMVNGLSFVLTTQADYDTRYTTEEKEDPHNIFIINDNLYEDGEDINNGRYAPPSVLRSGLNLKFKIDVDERMVMFSVDGKEDNDPSKTWYPAIGIIGNSKDQGILHPEWFVDIKGVIENSGNDSALRNQANYPFILNLRDNLSNIENAITGIKVGTQEATLGANPASHTLDITSIITQLINKAAQDEVANTVDGSYLKINNYIFKDSPSLTATDIQMVSNLDEDSYTTGLSGKSHYPSSYLVSTDIGNLKNRCTDNEGDISDIKDRNEISSILKSASETYEEFQERVGSEFGNFFFRQNTFIPKNENGAYVKRREKNGYNSKQKKYYKSEQGSSFLSKTILTLDTTEDGSKTSVSFTKRNGIGKLRMLFSSMRLQRDKTGYAEISSTSSTSAPSSYLEAYVAILEFPPGFYPAVSGYIPILNKVPDNPVVWTYKHDFIERARFLQIKKAKINGENRAFLVLNIQSSDPTTAIDCQGGIFVDYSYIIMDDPNDDPTVTQYTGTNSDNWGDVIDDL